MFVLKFSRQAVILGLMVLAGCMSSSPSKTSSVIPPAQNQQLSQE